MQPFGHLPTLVAQNERSGHILHVNKVAEVGSISFDDQRLTVLQPMDKLSGDDGIGAHGGVARAIDHKEAQVPWLRIKGP